MLVIVTENAPSRLTGYLSRFLVEIRAGVFIGNYGARIRETLWSTVCKEIKAGNAVIAWSTNNESGYDFETVGANRRLPTILEGLKLVSFLPIK
jgi:CRISPR-associated protein Cas2